MSDWISITDALPIPEEMVLVTCVAKNGNRSVNRAYIDEQGFFHGFAYADGTFDDQFQKDKTLV